MMEGRKTRSGAEYSVGVAKPNRNRPFPRFTLEEAFKIPLAIKDKNGGNPCPPRDVADAIGAKLKTNPFFYLVAASRDYGLTTGGRDSKKIELTPFGRELVFAPDPETETKLKKQAFLKVEKFKQVLDYYKGNQLPEMKYLQNTLQKQFGLAPETHEDFSRIFRENCDNLGIGTAAGNGKHIVPPGSAEVTGHTAARGDIVTLAEPETETGRKAFVIFPFNEREEKHPPGFFNEVLKSLIVPAGRDAGFIVITANQQGSDVIQSTIVQNLIKADLVIADLTEHNPNVLCELGIRMAFDKPVALIRASGTAAIFDVDNMLRVYDYDPNLWKSSIERDLPKLTAHIKATWDRRDDSKTYMQILGQTPAEIPVEPKNAK